MKRLYKTWHLIALALSLMLNPLSALEAGAATPAWPQRARQQRKHEAEKPPPIPAGSHVLPTGTVLLLQMETPLDSKSSRASDRFTAELSEPVTDAAGKVLVPQGTLIEGHVTSATQAQLRRRSGIIAVTFDQVRMADGRALPIDGELTSADPRERKRIDEEGQIKGGGTTKRTLVFIGGGAASGALSGAIIGGVILGAGIGAAAGAAGAWLAKGKEAIVAQGSHLGVRLLRPLDLNLGASGIVRVEAGGTKPVNETPSQNDAVLVRLSGLLAERMPDGSVHVVITAETNSAGWHVYADHSLAGDTLEIWLRGVRPKGMAAQVISHPTATVRVPDATKDIRRVLVHGANGDRTTELSVWPTA
jgi:hypothetical protein